MPKKSPSLQSHLPVHHEKLDRGIIFLTELLGSVGFLIAVLMALCFYVLWNLDLLPGIKPFDTYPFSGLDSVLSVFAVVLSICVLISQNRLRRLEKVREQVEFEVNVRAETEITKILEMLHDIQKKIGIDKKDPELEIMKQTTDLNELHKQIDQNKKG